jgi:Asp-tRNA(Asn)/Glu-tRNA(Gln) amidotransferase A subunit family amidase
MDQTRRDFLARGTAGLGALAVGLTDRSAADSTGVVSTDPPPPSGAAEGASTPSVKPKTAPLTAENFAAAETIMEVSLTPAQRTQAASSWTANLRGINERRTGPRRVPLAPQVAPYSSCNPRIAGASVGGLQSRFVPSTVDPGPLPAKDADIAYAPLTQLAGWIARRQISSERLTHLYLERLSRHDRTLRCVITLTPERALAAARVADQEIARGHYRGPLHGIPWGAKDLIDTAGIRTTYGAEPYRERVPTSDAAVVERLDTAGAVLVAKLSLGALALNDVWFGGQTMNPWLLDEGASGSSAGPGAATAAGLVGFSVGSETGGSIIAPSMRCGVTGLRPTYGRVPRTGAMTLCWSLDKLGPMTRGVEDTMLVLAAINGQDAGDLQSVTMPIDYDATQPVEGLRVGYFPGWLHEEPATQVDRSAIDALRRLGLKPTEVSLPDWPYASLQTILFAESAAAFEELTLSGAAEQLRMQTNDAWPNVFRQSRFLSAVDFVQADRLRRRVAEEMARVMNEVDLLVVPSLRDDIVTITNATGHPSLTLRAGFVDVTEPRSDWAPDPQRPPLKFAHPRRVPHGITLLGRLYDEGTIVRVGIALERGFDVARQRPAGFG